MARRLFAAGSFSCSCRFTGQRRTFSQPSGGTMRKLGFVLAALATTGCIAVVGNTTRATVSDPTLDPVHDGRITAHAGAIEWRTGPASLPAGAEMSVLEGDPTSSAPFTMRLCLPRNY